MKEELKQELIKEAINKLDNPWKNLTVKDVSKDLKMGENLTNELFKRANFPSIILLLLDVSKQECQL